VDWSCDCFLFTGEFQKHLFVLRSSLTFWFSTFSLSIWLQLWNHLPAGTGTHLMRQVEHGLVDPNQINPTCYNILSNNILRIKRFSSINHILIKTFPSGWVALLLTNAWRCCSMSRSFPVHEEVKTPWQTTNAASHDEHQKESSRNPPWICWLVRSEESPALQRGDSHVAAGLAGLSPQSRPKALVHYAR